MKSKIQNIEEVFPEIISIMVDRYNRTDFWINTTDNLDLNQVREDKQAAVNHIIDTCPLQSQKAVSDLLRELSDLDCQEISINSDMAFVDGFRTGAKLLLEMLK